MDRFTSLFGTRRGSVIERPDGAAWSVVVAVSRQLSDDAAAMAGRHWEHGGVWWVELRGWARVSANSGELRGQLQRGARMWCAAAGVKVIRTPQVRLD